MAEKKPASPVQTTSTSTPGLFTRENYKWMIIGVVVMALGFVLMSGGKSSDPTVFSDDQVYSFRRITLAPIVILIGLGIEVFAIFRKPKN